MTFEKAPAIRTMHSSDANTDSGLQMIVFCAEKLRRVLLQASLHTTKYTVGTHMLSAQQENGTMDNRWGGRATPLKHQD